MSFLTKLRFKTVIRHTEPDPALERRKKFMTVAEEQRAVVAAALKGETFAKPAKTAGTMLTAPKIVRPWFFQKDGGWYLQPRYGARVLLIDGKSNAIFAAKLSEVDTALAALIDATKSGELDDVLKLASRRGSKSAP